MARRFFLPGSSGAGVNPSIAPGVRSENVDLNRETPCLMLGNHIHLTEVDSTLSYAKRRFTELPDGAFLTADFQTAGRGRLGRKWFSPPRTNLLCAFVMKRINVPFRATCAVSLAILKLLRAAAPGTDFFIKWPNDIYSARAKIAGVLCEGMIQNGKIAGIIAGAGINVNLSLEDLLSLDQEASSLRSLAGREFDLKKMTSQLEKFMKECYIECLSSPEFLFKQWKTENRLVGHILDFIRPDGTVLRGVFHSILEDGSLQVRPMESSECVRFDCGDLRIGKNSLPDIEKHNAGNGQQQRNAAGKPRNRKKDG